MITELVIMMNTFHHEHVLASQKSRLCGTCGSSTHTTTDHYDIKWFKIGKALQAKKVEALKSTRCDIKNPIWYLDSGCSRHMTGVKSYLHKYEEQPGPKVVFGDDSTCVTKGYGSIKCNGIVFTKVTFVNRLKYNLISISQLCDAKYQTNRNDVSFIEPYECPEPVVLESEVSSDQNGQTDQNDQSVQNDEILNDDHSEHSNHTNDEQIIDNLINTEDIQIFKHSSSLREEDTLVQNTIPNPNPPLAIPLVDTPAPQDKWS
ncbi:hypothetical protein Tco_1029115 [Tanacetum coccineum]|uniref:Retrovirus-related Pol polyprotein from transposon TNT 1-94-like beta-barrel domain-containing protein n=1 Tax=Tanacetum coccineum TaxID=301880 RepID=A0ABQ5G440_9ASTR